MRHVVVLVCVALGFGIVGPPSSADGNARAVVGPPAGLSISGRTIWNLEALLHDTFGSRRPNLRLRNFGKPENFSLAFNGNCCSGYYVFTFSTARGSQFQALRIKNPPKPIVGASGAEIPLTIRGAYIYCGGGNWLYLHEGGGPANWQLSCHGEKI